MRPQLIDPKTHLPEEVAHDRKASGYIFLNGIEVAATRQCCHCNKHFLSVKGSGLKRGFCMRCMKVTCGSPDCDACIPFEEKLNQYAKGMRDTL